MSFRTTIIAVNGVVFFIIIVVIAVKVISQRRNPVREPPQNLTPFLDDETLEGRKLERVLGLSLLAVLVIALALPVYFLLQPSFQADVTKGFDDRSIERGAVLFADPTGKAYDSTRSLQCARCHGAQGQGGTAPFVLKAENQACADPKNSEKPECLPVQVSWAAPALQLAGLRYSRDQLTQIITYGRPGTPMPAWGVASGKGVLNTQGIDDLVNYVESLKISPAKAKKQAADLLKQDRSNAAAAVTDAQKALSAAQAAAAAAPTDADKAAAVVPAQQKLDNASAWNDQVSTASDGALLFQLNCARCHTKGWSYYDPQDPSKAPLPGPMGGGAYGPNLRDGDVVRQFPPPTGVELQYQWIAVGVPQYQQYGVRGISSGRMPHFSDVLTKDQIDKIVDYERNGLSGP